MLREIKHVRQIAGEPERRWFTDSYFDLIVWFDTAGAFTGFQLSYDKEGYERAFTWNLGRGYSHDGIDTGEQTGRMKKTPILIEDGVFEKEMILKRFSKAAEEIDQDITIFIIGKISEYYQKL